MKRIFAAIMALALVFGAVSALAAPGDATIYNQSSEEMQDIYINNMAWYNGVLYMADWGENIYTWTRESGEIKTWPIPEGIAAPETDGGYSSMSRLISGDDGIYLLYEVYEKEDDEEYSAFSHMLLYKPTVNGEEIAFDNEPQELDWDDLVQEYDDYSYASSLSNAYVADGMLIGYSYTESGDPVIAVIDIEDDDMELLSVDNIRSIAPYKAGKALAVVCNYESENDPSLIVAVDLETGETEELMQIATTGWSFPSQLAYDEAADALYYVLNGELNRVTGMDPATTQSVAAINVDSWTDNLAYLTGDGYYICGDYSTIIIRNTDPTLRSSESITVYTSYNSAMEKAFYDFGGTNPDVEVIMATTYEDLTQAMMNQSSSIDVYTVYVNSQDFAAIFDRGYMAELDSSQIITDFVNSVYPNLSDVLVRDGHVVAVPVEIWTSSFGYNPVAFEKLGLTEDDVPTSWPEFLQFAKDLPALLGDNEDGYALLDPYYTAEDARNMLFYEIIDDYMAYLQQDGVEFAFDTELLRGLLKTLDEIDFSALGFLESYDDDGISYAYNDETVLFNTYADISSNVWFMNNEFCRPMPLSMEEGGEARIMTNMTVAFVNPYSQKKELAISYLESAVNSIDHTLRVNMCPGYNEPLENSYYEENIANMQEAIDNWEAQLEKTDDEEARNVLETSIADYKEYMDEYTRENRYEVSEESIAYYRNYAGLFSASQFIGFDEEASNEFYTQLNQYIDGAIDADTFLKNIDKKLRMMMLEDQ